MKWKFWEFGRLWFVWDRHWSHWRFLRNDEYSIYAWELYIPHVVRISMLKQLERVVVKW